MDFLLTRGENFEERFDFKNEKQRAIVLPSGEYRIVLQRGTWVREYKVGAGLSKTRTALVWKIAASDTSDFEYRTLYYTLYKDDEDLVRGVIKVQGGANG